MSKVSKLQIVPKYNLQSVEVFEELLQRAKDGEITEFAGTVKLASGEYEHRWTGCENLMEMVGVLERQKMATLRRMDQ